MKGANILGKIYLVLFNPLTFLFTFFYCIYKVPGDIGDWWLIPAYIAIFLIHVFGVAFWATLQRESSDV